MARVWLAEAEGAQGFRKKVVLKTMLPTLTSDQTLVKMFIEEATVAARFEHDNIVRVFDFGSNGGQYFIAMEYVAGRTLRQIISRANKQGTRLEPWFFVRVLASICHALEYVHTFAEDDRPLGLVHRDVSPENIMVSFTGTVKLVDFGVAHTATSSAGAGLVVGKYRYMAPERTDGSPGGPESDLYSVGVILRELLTGDAPRSAADDLVIMRQVLEGTLPPLDPSVDPRLAAIVTKAMSRHQRDRYLSATRLGRHLSRFLADTDPNALHRSLALPLAAIYTGAEDLPSNVRAVQRASSSETELPQLDDMDIDVVVDDVLASPPPPLPSEPTPSAPLSSSSAGAPSPSPIASRVRSSSSSEDAGAGVDGTDESPESVSPAPAEDVLAMIRRRATRPPPSGTMAERPVLSLPPTSRSSIFDSFSSSTAHPGASSADPFSAARRPAMDPFTAPGRSEPPASAPAPSPWRPSDWGGRREVSPDVSSDEASRAFEQGLRALREKDYELALTLWQRAVDLDGDNRVYESNLNRLKRMKDRFGTGVK